MSRDFIIYILLSTTFLFLGIILGYILVYLEIKKFILEILVMNDIKIDPSILDKLVAIGMDRMGI